MGLLDIIRKKREPIAPQTEEERKYYEREQALTRRPLLRERARRDIMAEYGPRKSAAEQIFAGIEKVGGGLFGPAPRRKGRVGFAAPSTNTNLGNLFGRGSGRNTLDMWGLYSQPRKHKRGKIRGTTITVNGTTITVGKSKKKSRLKMRRYRNPLDPANW